ncbi:hexapeptide repeat-containing transferase [Thermostichus vulcanus NIES-2134]|nr:hexapeptide repeat-containing transferase [Thermostichus vulcanus NIES-2134]
MRVRMAFLRLRLGYLGPGAHIFGRCRLTYPSHIRIGADTSIGVHVSLHASSQGFIVIGERCAIAAYTRIITPTHDSSVLPITAVGINKLVSIDDHVWIGTGAIILPGVKIGSRSIVAAGAVVNRDVPEDVLVAGVPARIVKNLPPAEVRFGNGLRVKESKRASS